MREVLGVGFLAAVSLIMGLFARTKAAGKEDMKVNARSPDL